MMKDEFSINLAEENESLVLDLKEQYVAIKNDEIKAISLDELNSLLEGV